MKRIQAAIFKVGQYHFALSSDDIKEIIHIAEMFIPPEKPWFLDGFIDIGGQMVPVLALHQLFFSTPSPQSLYTPLIILKPFAITSIPYALLVDAVLELATIDTGQILAVQENYVFNNSITGGFEREDSTQVKGKVFLLSPQRLLLVEEQKRLEALQEASCQRLKRLPDKNDHPPSKTETIHRKKRGKKQPIHSTLTDQKQDENRKKHKKENTDNLQ